MVLRDNPNLVYGRMTGWGQTGPLAEVAGHDLNYISRAGALWYASNPGEAPFTPPTLVGDIGGGALYLVIGMLSALLQVKYGGQGCVVDAAIVDGAAHMMSLLLSLKALGGLNEARGTSILTDRIGAALIIRPVAGCVGTMFGAKILSDFSGAFGAISGRGLFAAV